MERFVLLPFSMGCVSQSSTQVGSSHPKKSKSESNPDVITGMISLPICVFLCVCTRARIDVFKFGWSLINISRKTRKTRREVIRSKDEEFLGTCFISEA